MKPLVIYHANCTDGFGAAFAAWLKFGDEAEYVPMDYLKATDGVAEFHERVKIDCSIGEREVYILDFSLPKAVMDWLFGHAKRVVWLDHHRSAFEMWCGKSPDLFFTIHKEQDESKTIILDDCRSGAMLAWRFFHPGTEVPKLIQHIDDRDRWQYQRDRRQLTADLGGSLEAYRVAPLYLAPGAQAQPAPSVPECPYPCGWQNLLTYAIKDGAYLARAINEDEPVTENARAATMRMVMRLRDVLIAINNAAPVRTAVVRLRREAGTRR